MDVRPGSDPHLSPLRAAWISILFFALLSLCACSGGETGGEEDDGADASDDITADSSDDVAPDVEDDADPPDSGDAEPEGDVGEDSDVEPDADADAREDADIIEDVIEDVDTGGINSCGGVGELRLNGDAVAVGSACGPCSDGVVVCNGTQTLMCVGETEPNACGGCGDLAGTPGDACGPCDDGTWTCEDTELVCADAGPINLCGGCGELDGQPAWKCQVEGTDGTWICDSTSAVACLTGGRNACGGQGELLGNPGGACGRCGLGVLECAGTDDVACNESAAPMNACGGCSPLRGEPGASCGECGTWECRDGNEALVCVQAFNGCGGCETLQGNPGDACEGGALACAGRNALECAPEPANACGGSAELSAVPGDPCGDCGDGVTVCAGLNATACVGSTPLNACDGCGILPGEPDASCGLDAVWACNDDGTLSCNVVDPLNACGGTTELDGSPGAACPGCDLQRYVCISPDALECIGGTNACGGCSLLLDPDDGEITSPGVGCGTCDSGRLRCNPEDDNALLCIGDQGADAFLTIYEDNDDDGYGDPTTGIPSCDLQDGFVQNANDCDDSEPTINLPNACTGCAVLPDGTNPGLPCGTCDSGRWTCNGPDATICVGDQGAAAYITIYRDADGDGFGDGAVANTMACGLEAGWVTDRSDCDDGNPDVHENNVCGGCAILPELVGTPCMGCGTWVCDGPTDVMCDTSVASTWHRDADMDGFGDPMNATQSCTQPLGYVRNAEDCDDTSAAANPNGTEVPGDEIDGDCNGTEICFADLDQDGYADAAGLTRISPDLLCETDQSEASDMHPGGDCDDGDSRTHPDASEVCDGSDNDCNGFVDDGLCGTACTPPAVNDADYLYVPCWQTIELTGSFGYARGVRIDGTVNTEFLDIDAPNVEVSGEILGNSSSSATPRANCVQSSLGSVGTTSIGASGFGSGASGGPTTVMDYSSVPARPIFLALSGRLDLHRFTCAPQAGQAGGCSDGGRGGALVRFDTDRLYFAETASIDVSAVAANLDDIYESGTRFSWVSNPNGGAGAVVFNVRESGDLYGSILARGLDPIVYNWEETINFGASGGGLVLLGEVGVGAITQHPTFSVDVSGGDAMDARFDTTGVVFEAIDADGDGAYTSCEVVGRALDEDPPVDCDDSNPLIHPYAVDAADGVDNNCNGEIDEAPGIGEGCEPGQCFEGQCSNGICTPTGEAYVAGGVFLMGAGSSDTYATSDEEPQHEVELTYDLLVQTTELTRQQWSDLGFSDPSPYTECGADCPVTAITVFDALFAANALSVDAGLESCYQLSGCTGSPPGATGCDVNIPAGSPHQCRGYRLPTESEWEYFTRAGTTEMTYNGNFIATGDDTYQSLTDIAWYRGDSEVAYSGGIACDWISAGATCGPHSVAQRLPNPWGLYDTIGNASELVWTPWPTSYTEERDVNPSPPSYDAGWDFVLRGGSWEDVAELQRSSSRQSTTANGGANVGVRLVRTYEP